MTGAADSLDAGLVSEPLERREPRFEAEYAFGAGFRAWRAESEKNKTDVLVHRGAPLRKIRVAERDIERQNRVLYSVVKTVERSESDAPRALFASDRMKEGVTPWGAAVRRLKQQGRLGR